MKVISGVGCSVDTTVAVEHGEERLILLILYTQTPTTVTALSSNNHSMRKKHYNITYELNYTYVLSYSTCGRTRPAR